LRVLSRDPFNWYGGRACTILEGLWHTVLRELWLALIITSFYVETPSGGAGAPGVRALPAAEES